MHELNDMIGIPSVVGHRANRQHFTVEAIHTLGQQHLGHLGSLVLTDLGSLHAGNGEQSKKEN